MEEYNGGRIRYEIADLLVPFLALRHFPEIRKEEKASERGWEYFTSAMYVLSCSSLYAMTLSEWLAR